MDSSADGAILDFDLGELGMIASSQPTKNMNDVEPNQSDLELGNALNAFDQRLATSGKSASVCVVRIGFGSQASETVKSVVRTRTMQKLERATREGDVCLRVGNDDVVMALSGCDVESARNSMALLMKLFAVEMVHGPNDEMKISAGIAPWTGDARAAQRTALLACDLASFQENGYIEVVEF